MVQQKVPTVVAHRGYAAHYPENTLEAIRAALESGIPYVEVDIQLTSDKIPILFHDAELARTTDAVGSIFDRDLASLGPVSAGEPARFGQRFETARIPTLAALVDLLRAIPEAGAFIEIKEESLARFGHDEVCSRVLAELAAVNARCCVISYDEDALRIARDQGASAIGWVLTRYDAHAERAAGALSPDFLICNYTKLPPDGALWTGPWRWLFYEVVDPELALTLAARGADMIETMAIGAYLHHPAWRKANLRGR